MRTFLAVLLATLALLAQDANNPARAAGLDLSKVQVPPGFRVSIFADTGVNGARFFAISPSGTLFVSGSQVGRIYALPDVNRVGTPDRVVVFASGLNYPHGLAFVGNDLYVAEQNRVTVYRNVEPDLRAGTPQVIAQLPSGGHISRTVLAGPDGKLYVSTGSSCDVCVESDSRRAAVQVMNLDGSSAEVFARGLRNSVGVRFHPTTGELWGTDHGRDHLGDNLPFEEINILRRGADYGWPYCHGNRVPNPEFNDQARCNVTDAPVWTIQAHSAGLGLSFYTGTWFPPEYQGDAFEALHGSWNRSVPTGYKVIRLRNENGRPVAQEDFLWNFLDPVAGTTMARPSDVITGSDGALYVADDVFHRIYRITYDAPAGPPIVNAGGVTNAASYSSTVALAPGALFTIFGGRFLGRSWQALALPLPTAVDQLRVTLGGKNAELLYAGASQINAHVPDGLSGSVELRVAIGTLVSSSTVTVASSAPGIFSQDGSGGGAGAVRNATRGGLVTAANPARAGDFLEIYATGLGGKQPVVTLDAQSVPVLYAGPAPGFVGVDQINVQVPAGVAGSVSLRLNTEGKDSNTVQIVVQ